MNFAGRLLSDTPPLALGLLAFFLIAGPRALDPTNIAWLGTGDPATHYLGWLFYRNSPWQLPIGINPSYGLEISNSILYSDSNPLMAVLFKPFSALLPETFQYFGIWILLCFILQAWFAWKLFGLITSNKMLMLLGAGLIVFSPPMIWRLNGHLSLVGHFLIIASLYLAFNQKPNRRKRSWGILLSAAALVHAYLLAMVLAIWIADFIGRTRKLQLHSRESLIELSTLFITTSLICWQVGYFSVGPGTSSSGYGFHKLNLLSIVDPSGWSHVMRKLPVPMEHYEGFNFLGAGVIFLLILSTPIFITRKGEILNGALKHRYILMLLIALALFSITNNISIASFELTYPLPTFILELANIFRASGRMFWPVFYAIIFTLAFVIIRTYGPRTATLLLGLALTIQILDTSAGWLPIREKLMAPRSSAWNSPLTDEFWRSASIKYRKIRQIPISNHYSSWQNIAYYAGQNRLSTDAVYLARINPRSLESAHKNASEVIRLGNYEKDSIYILSDEQFRAALINGNRDSDLFTRIDGFNVVAPGWKDCADCRFSGTEISITDVFEPLAVGERIIFDNAGQGINFLGSGWSAPEPWGTWSDGLRSVVFLPTRPHSVGSLIIEFNTLITHTHPLQRVDILVNGSLSSSLAVREPSKTVEVKLPEGANVSPLGLKLEFRLPDAIRPKDVGLGGDRRKMALGLKAITLQ